MFQKYSIVLTFLGVLLAIGVSAWAGGFGTDAGFEPTLGWVQMGSPLYAGAVPPNQVSDVVPDSAIPMALAVGDFDEDGMPDLVVAYETLDGGLLALFKGNVAFLFPNHPSAVDKTIAIAGLIGEPSPFLGPTIIKDYLTYGPDFLGAGDFDADGHADLVTCERGGTQLDFLFGDGSSEIAKVGVVSLSGGVTAMAVADVNRQDGLPDILLAVKNHKRAELQVLESPTGAMRADIEAIPLPAEGTAIVAGVMDGRHLIDMAVAAGNAVVIVEGRDRKLSIGVERRGEIGAPSSHSLLFQKTALALAVGLPGASEAGTGGLAIAFEDDSLKAAKLEGHEEPEWVIRDVGPQLDAGKKTLNQSVGLPAAFCRGARVSEGFLSWSHSRFMLATGNKVSGPESVITSIIAMRLNSDAFADFVFLEPGSTEPRVQLSKAVSIFVVDSIGDAPDANTGDGVCDDGAGACTLRAAIEQANASIGADEIQFNIAGSGVKTIVPNTELPHATEAVVIDGTTQPGYAGLPLIQLYCLISGTTSEGLTISGVGASTVRGLVINANTKYYAALKLENGSNFVEACFLCTDSNGTAAVGQPFAGVQAASDANLIGGAVPQAMNIISGCDRNVRLEGSGNQVQGNRIGSDVTGTERIGGGLGIEIGGSGNKIGGGLPGSSNLISGNLQAMEIYGTLNSVTGNLIGTDESGLVGLWNGWGIRVDAAMNTIGGTSAGERNVISGNNNGVSLFGPDNLVLGNWIGTDINGDAGLGNVDFGVALLSTNNTVGGVVSGAGNVISGNGKQGIFVNGTGLVGHLIQGNSIGVNSIGSFGIPNLGGGILVANTASGVTIGGIEAGAENTIAFNGSYGVLIEEGVRNEILSNRIFSNSDLGIDLGDAGVTPNDALDADLGSNFLQNYPVLSQSASCGSAFSSIDGTLHSASSTVFRIELFVNDSCDSSGYGEGQDLLEGFDVTTDGSGDASFSRSYAFEIPPSQFIAATATDPDGNTSEFSACVAVVSVVPTPTISGPATVCLGETITLDAGAYDAYSWSTGATTQNIDVSPAVNTDYTVSVTTAELCTGDSPVHAVTVYDYPTPSITGPSEVCAGSSVTLDAGAGYSGYLWSSGETTQTIVVGPAVTTAYTVTVTNTGGCEATSVAHDLTVKPAPTPVITGLGEICAGVSVTLDAGAGFSSYLWSSGETTQTIVVSPANTTDYTVTVTNAEGCDSTSAIHTVTVNALPAPAISGPSEICGGDSATLDAGSGYSSYLWSSGEATQTIDVSPANTTGYTVTVTNADGCEATSTSHNLTVNTLPTPAISGLSEICAGVSVTLDAGAGFSSYLWSSGETTQTIDVSPADTTDYTVTVTNAEGCDATSAIHTLTVHENPTPAISGLTEICGGESATLDAGAGYSSYLWSSGETTQAIVVSPGDTTDYTVTVTNTEGCDSTSAIHTLTVHAQPVPVISGPSEICGGDSATLDAGSEYSSYLWSTGATTQIIQVSPTEITVYGVTVASAEGCSATSPDHVLIVNTPPVVEAGPDIFSCVNISPFLLAGGAPPGGVWSGNGVTDSGAGLFDPAIAGDGAHLLSYQYTDLNGCSEIDTMVVTIDGISPLPVMNTAVETPGDCTATVNWAPSPSEEVTHYNVYSDDASGVMDYSSPVATLPHTESTWTSGSLPDGEHQFVVRAADACDLEDSSENTVGVSPCDDGCLNFNEQGQSLCSGNGCFKITYYATNPGGCYEGEDVESLRFQYRSCGSGPWWDMASCNPATQNPMPVPPNGKAMIHWAVPFLPDGCYQIRALPTIAGIEATTAPFGTIQKTCENPSIEEWINGQGEYETKVKVFANADNNVEHGDPVGAAGDAPDNQPSTVTVPLGSLGIDDTIQIAFPDPDDHARDVANGREFRRISLEGGELLLQEAMTIAMAYHDVNNNGFVDNPLGEETVPTVTLAVSFFDGGKWIELSDSVVDLNAKTVAATTNRLGLFGLLSSQQGVFSDGFESGDALRWSATVP